MALSFDDGPNPPDTNELLAILERHQVKATFFVVGKNLEKSPEIGKSIIAAGHTLGNHAYNHNFFTYFVHPSLKAEIIKTQEIIKKITGQTPALFRSPWLIRHPSLLKAVKTAGLTPISGIFGTQKEVWRVNYQIILRDALQKIHPGRILIFHDGFDTKGGDRSQTVKAIDLFITAAKVRGYKFVTVNELLETPAYQSTL